MAFKNIQEIKPGTYAIGRDKQKNEISFFCSAQNTFLNVENGQPVTGIVEYTTDIKARNKSKIQQPLPIFEQEENKRGFDETLLDKAQRVCQYDYEETDTKA